MLPLSQQAAMRVLIAFDGSPGAAQAVALAETIAWPLNSRLRLVSVVDAGAWATSVPRVPMAGAPWYEPELVAGLEAGQGEILERFATMGLAEAAVLRGHPAGAIVDDARTFDADLVIVGSRGHGQIAALVLGSVSAGVVDQASSPVLVARSDALSGLVVATDGSPSARAAEDVVARWPIFDRLPIGVVSVADVDRPWTSGIAPMFQRRARDAYADDLQGGIEEAERIASAAATRLREAGRDADATQGRGNPATEVLNFAEERAADLIVLGSRGRSAMAEILLGSVARSVVARSTASVLVVHEPEPVSPPVIGIGSAHDES